MDRPPSRLRRLLLTAGPAAFLLPACRREETPPPPVVAVPPPAPSPDWLLTPGAPPPDWSLLDAWQDRVTRARFEHLLTTVLVDGPSWLSCVELTDTAAHIRMSTPRAELPRYTLRFAGSAPTPPLASVFDPDSGNAAVSADIMPAAPGPPPSGRYWRRLDELPPLRDPAKPLQDVHIALDPGHIGGQWAQMEERYIQPGDPPPVKEGDLTLRTARVLAPMLEALGARITFIRTRPEPLTPLRAPQLLGEAQASLLQDNKPTDETSVRKESERLFYRTHEIRARAALINHHVQPDLVLHLHFNAEGGGGFTTANHLHIIAHGSLNPYEFTLDDQRLDGLLRILQGIPDTEIPLCAAVARRMAESTGLPAYTYRSGARMVPGEPYVWTRNLLASRVYRCPVVFTEPYVQNNAEFIERVRVGDYEGTAKVAGRERISLFREYATGVTEGLRDFFAARKA